MDGGMHYIVELKNNYRISFFLILNLLNILKNRIEKVHHLDIYTLLFLIKNDKFNNYFQIIKNVLYAFRRYMAILYS